MKNFYNIRDSYIIYKNTSNSPINIVQYLKIVNQFMKFLINKLFERGQILLPEKLGNLQIIGKKVKVKIENGQIKGLAPDWFKTKELWKNDSEAKQKKQLVYHFNEQTNGIRYRFFWSKSRVLVKNKTLYNVKMTRTNKRTLSQLVKNNKEYLIKN